ncbi:uncharacterized protein PFL1_00678 [Pseudozyma flocculosa PF-1]|uniref:CTLH domain-containing protein n=1 Tax=Pseudozyma flocculosa TaxID=84751 RepID=A0A5C3FG17_9BASI|nr:uncharacterized protein PFL1_00678 [Pseudozyma flocculosa PF-1]EPQ32484.1 hypothetical protein PFL1_00678 [Pseudozyma flocculosa PF-1]SPO42309.1 uncharacterized protein PSFLO_07792 [Pseudozyma flocculosa]
MPPSSSKHHSNGAASAAAATLSGRADQVDLTSPANLRKLVLNYLVHHCYADTASAFANDGISGYLAGPSSAADGLTAASTDEQPAAPSPSGSRAAASSSSSSSRASRTNDAASASPSQSASRSSAPATATGRQAHPLSAPPLSRQDSSMEVEADSLLALATSASSSSAAATTRGDHNGSAPTAMDEDVSMGEATSASHAANGQSQAAPGSSKTAVNGSRYASARAGAAGDLGAQGNADEQSDLPAAELRAVKIRKEIRDHIVNGRIRVAIDLCNTHFPAVLNTDAARIVTLDRDAGQVATSSTATDRVLPANPTSLDPAHLLLNLQIQVFIEIIRSATSSSSGMAGSSASLPPGSSPQISSSGYLPSSLAAANTPGIAAASISRAASPAPSSSCSSAGSGTSATGGAAAVNPALHSALAVAQGLYSSAQKLPSYWRAMYLKELEQVTALLAYPDVEHSPVRKFLHRSRKVALAEQVNSAILYRTGKPSQPLIESAVRQTAFTYAGLNSDKVAVPSGHPVFSVAGCPAGPYEETQSKKNGGGKILPPWNFRSFLAER